MSDAIKLMEDSKRRNFHWWRGNQKFYCGGKLLGGPKPYVPLLTFVLINLPAITADCFYLQVGLVFSIQDLSVKYSPVFLIVNILF